MLPFFKLRTVWKNNMVEWSKKYPNKTSSKGNNGYETLCICIPVEVIKEAIQTL